MFLWLTINYLTITLLEGGVSSLSSTCLFLLRGNGESDLIMGVATSLRDEKMVGVATISEEGTGDGTVPSDRLDMSVLIELK